MDAVHSRFMRERNSSQDGRAQAMMLTASTAGGHESRVTGSRAMTWKPGVQAVVHGSQKSDTIEIELN